MKKEKYIKPEMEVILLQSRTQLLAGSQFGIYSTDTDEVDEQYIL